MVTIWASMVSEPTFSARSRMLPAPLRVPAATLSPTVFSTGIGSPVSIDSSIEVFPSVTDAVDRGFSRRASSVTDHPHAPDPREISSSTPSRRRWAILGASPSKARMARAGSGPGPQFQHLAEEHQHDDNSGGLEIDRSGIVMGDAVGQNIGKQNDHHTEEPGRDGAKGNEREHVQVPGEHGANTPVPKGPATPEDHRSGKEELHPHGDASGQNRRTCPPMSSISTGSSSTRPTTNRRTIS